MKFQLHTKTKSTEKMIYFSAAKLLVGIIIQLINVKMPTIVGILTFMSR